MNNINSSEEISLLDIFDFISKSKIYFLLGALLGILFSVTYLFVIPIFYETKIVVQLSAGSYMPVTPFNISPKEMKERLQFSSVHDDILKKISPEVSPKEKKIILEALRSAKLMSSEQNLELTVIAGSPESAKKCINQMGQALIENIIQWEEPRNTFLSKFFEKNQRILPSVKDLIDDKKLHMILTTETLLSNPDLLKSRIISGPTEPLEIARPPATITIFKGLLIGLTLAFFVAYFRRQWVKEKLTKV